MSGTPTTSRTGRGNRVVAFACAAFLGAMFGAAYAAVPFYTWFCRATGFGGTTQVGTGVGIARSERMITVRFDANVAPDLPWRFEPTVTAMRVHLGEPAVATYRAVNLSQRPTTGTASYNVTPQSTGVYFDKVQCFCFTEQSLKGGESAELGVSFYVDPAMLDDHDTADIDTITLSYTFFPTRTPARPVASSGSPRDAVVR